VVGAQVTIRVVGAIAQPVHYRWDLSGQGADGRDSGASPVMTTRFQTPGPQVVGVQTVSASSTRSLKLILMVRPRVHTPKPVAPHASGLPAQRAPARTVSEAPQAHLAGDPGVTIVDFQFNPGSITIHTGDTITWTNSGAQPHTATANDHSFDTGILHKGQSGSHTFNQAGTFSYFCTVHPFMKATITVVASGSSGGGSGSGGGGNSGTGSGSSSTSPGTSSGASSGSASSSSAAPAQNLPFTGLNLLVAGMCGLLLIGSGLALRWRARGSRRVAARPDL
jgi:plastocyanin